MGATTGISWCDATWNPIVGCSKTSQGCRNCYAEVMGRRLRAMALAKIEKGEAPGRLRAYMDAVDERGRWTGKVVTLPEALGEPLKWRKPARIFVNSMSDLFHPDVPFEFTAAVFGVMAACPQHVFLVLTKRPERAREFFQWAERLNRADDAMRRGGSAAFDLCQAKAAIAGVDHGGIPVGHAGPWPLPNVHLGVSVEDQATADERIPLLLACPAAVRWVSAEPLLGPVDFTRLTMVKPEPPYGPGVYLNALTGHVAGPDDIGPRLSWVVVGGESGPNARPFDVAWARSVVRQCREAGVPTYVKQMGARPHFEADHYVGWPVRVQGIGRLEDGRLHAKPELKDRAGADPAEWPADLRVREFPEVRR